MKDNFLKLKIKILNIYLPIKRNPVNGQRFLEVHFKFQLLTEIMFGLLINLIISIKKLITDGIRWMAWLRTLE